ncbi:UNVERIFIED_CONTAM: hypothetical protein K2H54_013830 [Gekko kuhli]
MLPEPAPLVLCFEVEWTTASPDVVLHSDGKVEFVLSFRIDSNCNFDLFYYPQDEAHCTLSFFFLDNTGHVVPTNQLKSFKSGGSERDDWVGGCSEGRGLEVSSPGAAPGGPTEVSSQPPLPSGSPGAAPVNELGFKVSIENEILNVKREYLVTSMNATVGRDMPQPFFVVTIDLENTGIRTILSLIVPSVALMIADVCGFLLPLKERSSYMVTLLLAHLVFHSSLVGSLPGSSSCNPLLSYYYIGLLVLLFLSTIETILVTKLVADNGDLQLKRDFKGATATPVLGKNESDHPEDKKPRMNGPPTQALTSPPAELHNSYTPVSEMGGIGSEVRSRKTISWSNLRTAGQTKRNHTSNKFQQLWTGSPSSSS